MPPKSAALLARCVLAKPSPGGCRWCGKELPANRRTWCSERCAGRFWNNHWWPLARRAVKRRDRYRCTGCGHVPPKRPAAKEFHARAFYLKAFRLWRAVRRTERLEVHHRVPCLGTHATPGCAHHLDNLETLCVTCHRMKRPPI